MAQDERTPVIETIGVIGAGQMGNGIAHVGALAGYRVVLLDIDRGELEKAHGDDRPATWSGRSKRG